MRIGARRRLDIFLDEQGRKEIGADIVAIDRLRFKDVKKYKDRLTEAQKKTGEKDALSLCLAVFIRCQLLPVPLNLLFMVALWATPLVKNLPEQLLWLNKKFPLYASQLLGVPECRGTYLPDANGKNQCST